MQIQVVSTPNHLIFDGICLLLRNGLTDFHQNWGTTGYYIQDAEK
jgi:hypothetical protein